MRTPNRTSAIAGRRGSLASRFGLTIAFILISLAYSQAQEQSRFTADMGAGFSPLSGKISDRLDTGWNVGVSGGINFNSFFSTSVRYSFNGLGVNSSLLQRVGVPDGNANVWSITLDPKLQFARGNRIRPYVVGAVGYYRRTVNFTRPVLVRDLFFDPFFGIAFSALVVEDQTVKKVDKGGIGGDLGAGFDIRLGESGLRLFSEACYEYADTGEVPTRMIPVRFGLRW